MILLPPVRTPLFLNVVPYSPAEVLMRHLFRDFSVELFDFGGDD